MQSPHALRAAVHGNRLADWGRRGHALPSATRTKSKPRHARQRLSPTPRVIHPKLAHSWTAKQSLLVRRRFRAIRRWVRKFRVNEDAGRIRAGGDCCTAYNDAMAKSRRDSLTGASVLMAAASACNDAKQKSGAEAPPAGAPPAFGTSPEVGPPVSMATFAEAEKLNQFELKPDERQQAATSWRKTMAALYERRAGPRKFVPDAPVSPATSWNPMLPGLHS